MEKWVAAAAIAAGMALAVPFWTSRFVPLLDLPQHLALVTVIHNHHEPQWGFDRFFEVQWGELTPYWMTYLAMHLLAYLMPVETAARVYLSLYALAFPWAGISVCRAFGRHAWLGLLAAPLALNTNLYYGFVNYCAGTALLLFAVAALEGQIRAPRRGRGVCLAILTGALFFAHVQALVLFLSFAILLAATHPTALRARGAALLPLAPAVGGLLLPWAYLTFVNPQGPERQFASIHGNADAKYEGFVANLLGLKAALAGAFQDGSDGYVLMGWAAMVVAALVLGRRSSEEGSGGGPFRPASLVLLALLAYFVTPMSIKGQWNISPRFALPAALFVIPAIRGGGLRGRPWSAAALVLTFASASNAAWHHRSFDREVGPLEDALAAIPPGRRVLALIYDQKGRVLEKWPYLHFGQYVMVRRGGAVAASFAASAPMPVRYRDVASFPHPGVWTPYAFDPEIHGSHYDFVLVRRAAEPPPAPLAIDETPRLQRIREAGPWAVYRRVTATAVESRSEASPP